MQTFHHDVQGSHFVCRRKWLPVGGHFRRQIIYDRCTDSTGFGHRLPTGNGESAALYCACAAHSANYSISCGHPMAEPGITFCNQSLHIAAKISTRKHCGGNQTPTFSREFWPGPLPRSRLHVCRAQTQQRLSRSPFCRPRSPGRRCRRRQSERQRNGRVVLTFLSLLRRPFLRSIICGRRRSPVVISRFTLNYRAERRAGGRAASKV